MEIGCKRLDRGGDGWGKRDDFTDGVKSILIYTYDKETHTRHKPNPGILGVTGRSQSQTKMGHL